MLREKKESRRMKTIKKEFKERSKEKRIQERVERKKEQNMNISIIEY